MPEGAGGCGSSPCAQRRAEDSDYEVQVSPDARNGAGKVAWSGRAYLVLAGAGALCGIATVAFCPAPARAQSLSEEITEQEGLLAPSRGDWDVTVGSGFVVRPVYPGASSDHVRFVPLFSVKYKDLFFLGPGGLGMNALNWNGFRAGPVLGYHGGRDEGDAPLLAGLGNIDPSVTAGVFASYRFGPWEVYGTVRQAVTNTSNGLEALLRADYRGTLIAHKLQFAVGPEVSLANAQYSRTWFGINSEQSAQSGLPVFTPDGGLRDVGLHASLTYRLSDHILLRAFGSVRELTGSVASSPIVQTKTLGLGGMGLAYHF